MAKKSPRPSSSLKRQFLNIVLLATIPTFLLVTISTSAFLVNIRSLLQGRVEQSTVALHEAIRIQLESSIRVYLQAKVEVAMDVLKLTSVENIDEVTERLGQITIGETGYYYGLNSDGTVMFHPDDNLVGVNLADRTPVKEQLKRFRGYFEYDWQNTYETSLQAKALFMDYHPDLDWIVTATSYRREFSSMVDREAIRRIVQGSTFGESGYSYVFDREGGIIAHPRFESLEEVEEVIKLEDYLSVVDTLFTQQEGYTTYRWASTLDGNRRTKVVYLKYLPDFDWIIGTAVYRSEINRPVVLLVILDITVALFLAIYLAWYIERVNHVVSNQIDRIITGLEIGRTLSPNTPIEENGPKELRVITRHVNYYTKALDSRTRELEDVNANLENRIQERSEELSRSSQMLIEAEKQALTSRLVAGVAHEISNPLGLALTSVSFIHERVRSFGDHNQEAGRDASIPPVDFETIRDTLEIAEKNLLRAGKLIQSFKSVSSDQLSLSRRPFQLREVIDDVLISMKPLLLKKRIEPVLEVEDLAMNSYPGVFTHVLVNFISNSLTHGFSERYSGTIGLSVRREDDSVVLEYFDDGEGISPQIIDSVFDPFVTTRRNAGSIGLGLNIVENLVKDLLRGSLEVESRHGEYTRFRIVFPFPQDEADGGQ